MTANLAYAVPALAAATAYANAKLRLSVDYRFLGNWILTARSVSQQEKLGKATIFCRLEEHVADPKTRDEVFLIYQDQAWTFKQFYDDALRYAAWLHHTYHVQPKDVVALDFMNSAEFLFLIVGCWSLGAVPALINYNLVGNSLVHCVKVSTSHLMIVDPEVASTALTDDVRLGLGEAVVSAVLTPALQSSVAKLTPYRAPDSTRAFQIDSEPGLLIYTSGTTGNPKAAVITHPRLNFGGQFGGRFLGLQSVKTRQPDRFHTSMPLYHATAFNLGFIPCLYSATTFIIARKFSVGNFWPEVKKHDVTIIQYVGETLRYLSAAASNPAEDKNHKVRLAWGNGLRPDVWNVFKTRFGIDTVVELYGASEGFYGKMNINRNDFSDGAISTSGTVMSLMAHFKEAVVKIDWETEQPWRDPQTGLCKRANYNEAGELLYKVDAKDPSIQFRGYLGNPEASQKKILRDVLAKGDAYFRTGDAVKVDREGRTYFSDRIGDTFRWRSENVSTNEVGEVMGYHDAVIEANVYGVTVPGHEGRAGCAAILLKDDALKEGYRSVFVKEDVLQSLAEHAKTRLPKYAVPQFLRVVQETSLTGNNKQQKTGLRKQGIELSEIRGAGSSDKMYWLKPGTGQYAEFLDYDLDTLKKGRLRL